jgi:hypothetical protein
MTTIFIVGTFWFWSLIVLATILLIWAVDSNAYWKALLVLVGTFVVLGFFGAGQEIREMGSWVWSHPLQTFLSVLGYLVVGAVWSIFKWNRYLKILRFNKIEDGGKFSKSELENMVRYNKSRLISWMAYWPFSIIWTALSDPFQELYRRLSGTFQKLVYKNLSDLQEGHDHLKG